MTLWVVFTVITRLAAGSKEKASEESVQEGSRANVCTEGKSEPFQMHCVRPATPSLAITTHPGILR